MIVIYSRIKSDLEPLNAIVLIYNTRGRNKKRKRKEHIEEHNLVTGQNGSRVGLMGGFNRRIFTSYVLHDY
jgi:hypothetical protein